MKPELQRIAIAEAMGAKWSHVVDSELKTTWNLGFSHTDKADGLHWLSPGTYFAVAYMVASKPDTRFEHTIGGDVPDYLNDLNAMHEAEDELIKRLLWGDYRRALQKVTNDSGDHVNCIRATAAQRAEAFLRTLNLWTP